MSMASSQQSAMSLLADRSHLSPPPTSLSAALIPPQSSSSSAPSASSASSSTAPFNRDQPTTGTGTDTLQALRATLRDMSAQQQSTLVQQEAQLRRAQDQADYTTMQQEWLSMRERVNALTSEVARVRADVDPMEQVVLEARREGEQRYLAEKHQRMLQKGSGGSEMKTYVEWQPSVISGSNGGSGDDTDTVTAKHQNHVKLQMMIQRAQIVDEAVAERDALVEQLRASEGEYGALQRSMQALALRLQ
jgi:hypothetical protein